MSKVYDDLSKDYVKVFGEVARTLTPSQANQPSPAFLAGLTLRKAQELDAQISAMRAIVDDAKVKMQQVELSFTARMDGIVSAFKQVEIGLRAAAEVSVAAEKENVKG